MRFAVMLISALLAVPAVAKDWKVSRMEDLFAACDGAAPGDVILVAKGTYPIRDKSRISIRNRPGPVTVRGVTGNPADVVLEGRGQDDREVEVIFELTDSPAWTFQDLTTRNSYYHGFKFNGASTDCVLRNVVMRDHGESGVKGTSDPAKGVFPDRLLVEKCDIGFTGESGGTRDVVEGIDGVAVNGWVIRGSRFVNIQRNGEPAYGVFTKGNSSDTIIEGNRFEHCFVGASFGGGGTGDAYFRNGDRSLEHRRGVIRGNVFTDGTDAAIYLNKAADATIENNEMIRCAGNIQLRYPGTTAKVRNNISDHPQEPMVRLRDGGAVLEEEAEEVPVGR